MQTSYYLPFIQRYMPGIAQRTVTFLNGTTVPQPYYHKRFLGRLFSVDGKWDSISALNTQVMADIVSMDSQLPVKKRDSISRASGDIPKMGMKLYLREKALSDLQVLALRPETEAQLLAKLFADVPKVISGVWERNEAIFLEALSSGVCVIDDTENVGTGIRLDFNPYSYGVTTVWSNTASTPIDDFERIKTAARNRGTIITKFLMDRVAFNYMVATTQVKQNFAFSIGFAGTNIITPSLEQVNATFQSRYGYTVEIIERSVVYEKNGVQTSVVPWKTGSVVGIATEKLGNLVWANLAEQLAPVAGVSYQTVDDFILVSKYRVNDPLAEFTSSQARVVPVLENSNQLYIIDSASVQA